MVMRIGSSLLQPNLYMTLKQLVAVCPLCAHLMPSRGFDCRERPVQRKAGLKISKS